jgi:hypothetical protein
MEESALSNDILKLSNGLLEHDKPFKLFDMKKFQNNVNREMKRQYPDRRYTYTSNIKLKLFIFVLLQLNLKIFSEKSKMKGGYKILQKIVLHILRSIQSISRKG